jgi:hypothetical protein
VAHDAFISYSSKDKTTADATCATLEARGIRCWMAPRDILPGADWGETIVDAINDARVFVLVFSVNANESSQIKREVERAINRGIPVIPFRIENVLPTKSLEYFLSTPHWLDAFSPPLEEHLNYLASVISSITQGKSAPPRPQPMPPPGPAPTPVPHEAAPDRRLMIGGAAAVLALAGGGYFFFGGGRPGNFKGSWTAKEIAFTPGVPGPFAIFSIDNFYQGALAANKFHGSFSLDDLGAYTFGWGGEDTGTMTVRGNSAHFLSDSRRDWTFSYSIIPSPPPQMITFLGGHDGQAGLTLTTPGTQLSMLLGTSQGPGMTGEWMTDSAETPVFDATKTSLTITADGRYHYKFDFLESGTFQAANGNWTRLRPGAAPQTGNYKFDSSSQVTTANGRAKFVWQRS